MMLAMQKMQYMTWMERNYVETGMISRLHILCQLSRSIVDLKNDDTRHDITSLFLEVNSIWACSDHNSVRMGKMGNVIAFSITVVEFI